MLTEFNENEEDDEISKILEGQSSISPSNHMKTLSFDTSQRSSYKNADEEPATNGIRVKLSFNSELEELSINITKKSEENIHMDEEAGESTSKSH